MLRYRVLLPFHWHRKGQIISADDIRRLDVRYYLKKGMVEVYEEECAVAPPPEVETAVPKRKRKADV